MQRLFYSSKFWAIVIGFAALVVMNLFGIGSEEANEGLKNLTVLFAAIGPALYAILTAVEDAGNGKTIDIDYIVNLVTDLLKELLEENE